MIKNLGILILILAFIGIIVLLDLPKFQDILSLRKEIKEQKEKFSGQQNIFAKVEKLTQSYEKNKENLEKISYILPSGKDTPDLIVQLEALSLEGGLVLEGMGFSAPGEEGMLSKAEEARGEEGGAVKNYKTLVINLNLIGSYFAFKNFLKAVEDNIRLMDISSINFSPELRGESQLLKFNLSIKTYYQ